MAAGWGDVIGDGCVSGGLDSVLLGGEGGDYVSGGDEKAVVGERFRKIRKIRFQNCPNNTSYLVSN